MSSKIKISLAWQMMIGLALGIVVGALVDSSFAQTWLQPLGDLFIRLIRMVVVPLVLATIIAGAAGISDTSKLGRVAVKVLLVYAVTTGIAVACGLLFAGIIQPGMGLDLARQDAARHRPDQPHAGHGRRLHASDHLLRGDLRLRPLRPW